MTGATLPDDLVDRLVRRNVVTVSPDAVIGSVIEVMRLGRLRALPVVDKGERLLGALAFVDCCDLVAKALSGDDSDREVLERLEAALNVPVHVVMTPADQLVEGEANLRSAVRQLGDARWGHLCVVRSTSEGPRLLGLLTENDVLRHLVIDA